MGLSPGAERREANGKEKAGILASVTETDLRQNIDCFGSPIVDACTRPTVNAERITLVPWTPRQRNGQGLLEQGDYLLFIQINLDRDGSWLSANDFETCWGSPVDRNRGMHRVVTPISLGASPYTLVVPQSEELFGPDREGSERLHFISQEGVTIIWGTESVKRSGKARGISAVVSLAGMLSLAPIAVAQAPSPRPDTNPSPVKAAADEEGDTEEELVDFEEEEARLEKEDKAMLAAAGAGGGDGGLAGTGIKLFVDLLLDHAWGEKKFEFHPNHTYVFVQASVYDDLQIMIHVSDNPILLGAELQPHADPDPHRGQAPHSLWDQQLSPHHRRPGGRVFQVPAGNLGRLWPVDDPPGL